MDEICKSTLEQEDRGPRGPGGRWRPGQSGNPKGRPSGATCRALRMVREGAVDVAIPALVQAAGNGDIDACKALLSHGVPKQRPIELPEPIPLPSDTENMTEYLRGVLGLIAEGKISVSRGSEIATIVATIAKVDEVTQLREEVAHLTAMLDGRKVNPTQKGRSRP